MTMTTTPDTRTAPTRGRSVLTVEDNAFTRADLRFILETAGFEVCPDARDGIEAVEMARAWNPDAILLDLGLPHIDGVEAAKLILEDRDIPIVAVTGRTRAEEAQAIEAGVVACIRKPFSAYDVVK